MKVGAYVRISKDPEGTALGVARQEQDARKLARDRGWEVAEVYTDNDISATSGRRRPGWEQLLNDLTAGKVQAIVAYSSSRLYRRPADLYRLIKLANERGVEVATVASGRIDLSNADGRMIAGILAEIDQAEADRNSERIGRALQQRAEAGHYTGKRPFGYDIAPTNGGKTLRIRDDEAAAVREATEHLLNGRSLKSVAREWTETHRCGRTWTGNALRQMLSSPRLAGLRQYRGEIIGRAGWEPILDRRTWQRLMDLFKDPERITTARTRGDRYLLTGLLFCEEHGTRLAGRPVSYKRQDGARVSYRTYICTHGGPDQRSVHLGINAKRVEDYVGDMASTKTIRVVSVRDPSEVGVELLAIRDEVDARISQWNRNAATAGLSAEEIRDGRRDLVAERERIEAQIAEAAAPTQLAEPIWKKDATGVFTDEWRQMIAQRIQRVNVRAGAKTVPIEERAEIVWREGVIDVPWLTE